MKKFCLLLVCLMFAVPGAWANLLTNASFNTGPDDLNDWTGTSWTSGGNVGREWWASREGKLGAYFRTWDAAPATQNGYFYQDVPQTVVSGETNTYTFTIWIRRELNSNPTKIETKLEWLNGAFAEVEPQTIADWGGRVPNDQMWHPIYVTGSCTNPALVNVRCTVFVEWADPSTDPGDSSLMFDTADLSMGGFSGTLPLWNQSFEERNDYDDWRDAQWSREGFGFGFEDWGWHTRWAGIGFWGWAADSNDYTAVVKQSAALPGAGTYTLAAWIQQEANFLMTNAQLIIECYGTNMNTKVNDDIVTNLTTSIIADGAWREYHVTGNITGEVYEARVKYFVQWDENSTGPDPRAMKLDDIRLFAGAFAVEDPSTDLSGIYHNNTNAAEAASEDVPGLGGVKFFQYNYGGTNPESYVHVLVPEDSIKAMRARVYFANGGGEVWRNGAWYTNVVISSAPGFHGIPAAGSVTMEVWRAAFVPPGRWNDNMWYSPAVTLNDQRNLEWFLASEVDDPAITFGVPFTNDLPTDPQHFWTQTPYDHDYYYYVTGQVIRSGLKTDWAYYNNTNYDPEVEVVPEWDGTEFLQVTYLTTTTTFQVMTDSPIKENLLQDESIQVLMRTSWSTNGVDWVNDYTQMSWKTNLILDSASAFHGLPASGTHTVDLWQLNWTQPTDSGTPIQTAVTVYYAPLLKIAFGPDQYGSEELYLIENFNVGDAAGYGVNNYTTDPQLYGVSPFDDRDWFYINQPVLVDDSDGDGIADEWELDWFGNLTTAGVGTHSDADSQSDFEEWVSDTDPTDPNNYYTNVILGLTGVGTFDLQAGPPTTNSRAYGVWYSTNLVGAQVWQSYSVPVQGAGDGSAVTLSVTNDGGMRIYRTGVMIP